MPTLHRFFVPPGALSGEVATFDATTAHQLRDVLRLRSGDEVIVLDDTGWEYRVGLTKLDRSGVTGSILGKSLGQGEPNTKVVLYQSALKGSKFEWVLQKCTEVGIAAFVPMVSGRSIPKGEEDSPTRRGRWLRIVQEAAEQSRRSRLPVLNPTTPFATAMSSLSGRTLIAWEEEQAVSIDAVIRQWSQERGSLLTINLIVGPEGGFSKEEVDAAKARGAVPVSLGPRILRADTAGVVAGTLILSHLGEMEPVRKPPGT